MLKVVVIVSVALPCVLAVFNTPIGPDFNPMPGTLLQCEEDLHAGTTLTVSLEYTRPNVTYRPLASGYPFPPALRIPGFNPGIANLLNINMAYQRLSRPPDFNDVLYLPNRFDSTSADFQELQAICGDDVLANSYNTNSTRNEDQGTFEDIANQLNDEWLEIFDRGIPQESLPRPTPSQSRDDWVTDVVFTAFQPMIELLECRVAFPWADAGPSYFPRYFRQGFCYNRKCSLPDRDEFRCHADLSDDSTSTLEASRWDCCWVYDVVDGYKFECGFRKVNIPIVCDCDCRCIDKAGI